MPADRAENRALKKSVWDRLVLQKLSAPVVFVFLITCSLGIAYLVAREGYVTGMIILCAIIALPTAYAVVAYPNIGIILLLIVAFFINYSSRFLPEPTPIGLVMDAMTYLLLLGLFIKMKDDKHPEYFRNPISYFTLAWLGYNLLEVLNPSSPTILEWVYTVRTVAFIMLMYFVFLYHIR